MPPIHDRSRRGGFTLVEILVVIAIITIVAAIAIPALSLFTQGQGLASAARVVESAYSDARQRTISTRRSHWVVFWRFENEGDERIALRVFKEEEGFVGETHILPKSVQVDRAGDEILDARIRIFPEEPTEADVEGAGGAGFAVFESDGRIDRDSYDDTVPALDSEGLEIYDGASEVRSVEAGTPADIRMFNQLTQELLLVDLSPATGRVRTVLLQAEGRID